MELFIPRLVHCKLMHWVHEADIEVSGMGKVTYHPEQKVIEVHDVYMVTQKGGAAHTELDPEALNKLSFETRKLPGNLRFWWH